jgi:hypothetical protein
MSWMRRGFFFDDQFNTNGPTEYEAHLVEDCGLNQTTLDAMSAAYWAYMGQVYDAVLARGKFSWQQLWTGQGSGIGSTCPEPLVHNATCASDLRNLCSASSPAQTRAMMYAFYPGGCKTDPSNLEQPEIDIANFLLTRGPHSWIGHGWLGCSRTYEYPALLNADFGEPVDAVCHETGTNTGVFVREWSNAMVQMDCNTVTPTITWK